MGGGGGGGSPYGDTRDLEALQTSATAKNFKAVDVE